MGFRVVSRAAPEGLSVSRREGAFVEAIETALLPGRGVGGGGVDLAAEFDAILALRLRGEFDDIPTGVDERIDPLDGGGFGGGV